MGAHLCDRTSVSATKIIQNFDEQSETNKIKLLTTNINLVRKTSKFLKECLDDRSSVLKVVDA